MIKGTIKNFTLVTLLIIPYSPALAAGNTCIGVNCMTLGNDSTALGFNAAATSDNATALGANSLATAANSVALGQGSVSDRENTVSVGSSTLQRQITNVAAGVADTDAVNVSQLNNVMSPFSSSNLVNIMENNIFNLTNQLNYYDKKRGLASASALSGLFQPYTVGKFNVTAGIGGYRGQVAAAAGFGYRSSEIFAVKAGLATAGNNTVAYNAAANFEW